MREYNLRVDGAEVWFEPTEEGFEAMRGAYERAAGLAARLKAVERAILGHAQDALMNREFR